jgi:BirA family transcriptional regulator, biotin operon repressor / biotin---[acetyl-CoA-carboxylase] ligase
MTRRIHYEVIDSTNTEARRLVTNGGVSEPVLITADEQFAGRGRQGRNWHSPRGGAWMTLVWPASKAPAAYSAASLAAAVGVLRGLRDIAPYGADFRIKWPNDVLVADRKVAGILCEQQLRSAAAEAIIIGVGVNVDFDAAELPDGLRHPATTLRSAFGRPFEVSAVVEAVGERLVESLTAYEAAGLNTELLEELRNSLAYVGEVRQWTSPGSQIEGRVVGLDDEGRLVLDTPAGRVAWASGEFAAAQDSDLNRM